MMRAAGPAAADKGGARAFPVDVAGGRPQDSILWRSKCSRVRRARSLRFRGTFGSDPVKGMDKKATLAVHQEATYHCLLVLN